MIDYKQIVDNLNTDKIIALMETLGADDYIRKEGYIIFPTICHNESAEDASKKLYYYENSHIFQCYTSCGSMNIFTFMKHYYEARNIQYDWYNDIFKVISDCSNFNLDNTSALTAYHSIADKYITHEVPSLKTYPKGVLECFNKIYPIEWLNDGISKEAMDKFNILYSISQNKIIIPHYDINNNLIGIRGRALNQWEVDNVGKYMPVRIEETWYSHPLSLNLYGLNLNKEYIKRNHYALLFESEKSVMQFESFNRPNCALAVCGSNFNKFQLKLLMKECNPSEIILCFDKEELEGEDTYFNKLYKIGEKYKNYAKFSFIYDRNKLLQLKDSPSDKGQEIFEELLKRRVAIREGE